MSLTGRPLYRRVQLAAVVVGLPLPLLLSGCSAPHPAASAPRVVRIGTAFGPLPDPLAAEYRRMLPHLTVQSVPAPNSIDVVRGIQNGTLDFGVAYSNDTYATYWGQMEATAAKREIRG